MIRGRKQVAAGPCLPSSHCGKTLPVPALRDSIIQRVDKLVSAPMGAELAMMDLESGKYLVLDQIGAIVWEEIAEPIRVGDLVSRLQARFEVAEDKCEADVLSFLGQLQTKGLLRADEP